MEVHGRFHCSSPSSLVCAWHMESWEQGRRVGGGSSCQMQQEVVWPTKQGWGSGALHQGSATHRRTCTKGFCVYVRPVVMRLDGAGADESTQRLGKLVPEQAVAVIITYLLVAGPSAGEASWACRLYNTSMQAGERRL